MPQLSLSQINKINKPTVTKLINLLYSWGKNEQDEFFNQIQEERERAYAQKMTNLANSVGCSKRGRPPSQSSKRQLESESRQDAKSIVATWNKELENEIERLMRVNVRGNRFYYINNLEQWAAKRSDWKNQQISLQTRQVSEQLALQDFMNVNEVLLGGVGFIYSDIEINPPVSDECKARARLGVVNRMTMERNPTPAHIGCPHGWRLVVGQVNFDCRNLYVG